MMCTSNQLMLVCTAFIGNKRKKFLQRTESKKADATSIIIYHLFNRVSNT